MPPSPIRQQQTSLYWDEQSPPHSLPPPSYSPPAPIPSKCAEVDEDHAAALEMFPITFSLIKRTAAAQPAEDSVGVALEADVVLTGYVSAVSDELRRFIDFSENQFDMTTFSSSSSHHNRALREDLLVSKRVSEALKAAMVESSSARQELHDMATRRVGQLQQMEECIRLLALTNKGATAATIPFP